MAFVDESVVNVALPRVESDLATTLPAMQWVINAYTLSMSALLLVGGAAGDQFGRRRVFVIGVTVFAVASVACAIAGGVPALIAARAVQGAGAALLVPCSLALIGASFDEKDRGAAIGVWSGASAIAAGAAPLVGGWLVDHVSWRAIFLINPLLAIPTLWITMGEVPESRDPSAPPVIDWRGTLLAFAGLGCLVYGLISSSQLGWQHLSVIIVLAAGITSLVGFVLVERGSRWPMMPLELFRSRTFSGVNLLTLLLYGALGAAFFFLPFLLIQARGWSATATGIVYIPFALVLGISSRWSGGLLDRFGARRPLIAGPTLAALGFCRYRQPVNPIGRQRCR
jgi:EmrB/QacA subfamily drug resistance transporter